VYRVKRVFHNLEPVAGQRHVPYVPHHPVNHEQVPVWQQRRRFWAQIGKEHSAELLNRVSGNGYLFPETASRIFCLLIRLLKAAALLIEAPSVISATQADVFGNPVDQ